MEKAERFKQLPQELFSEIDGMKNKVAKTGIDIIDLSKGSPDLPPPSHIIQSHINAVREDGLHGYSTTEGIPELRIAVAQWYKKRYDVELDPDNEIISLIGTREGIAHIALVYINPEDIALIPDPAYPTYTIGTIISHGKPYYFPLHKDNDFLPDLKNIDSDIVKKAKIMFLNYPNNPTAGVTRPGFFEEVVSFARENDILVCHDLAYSEIVYDGHKAPSFLSVKGAKDVGIEFYSLSKTYNMAGWRLGFAVGNSDVIKSLANLKGNIDAGVFKAIQYAGVSALTSSQECVEETVKIYQKRRDTLVNGLRTTGWEIPLPKATLYVWAPIPENYNSASEFALNLLEKTGVVVVPGSAYGKNGEGYVRMALVVDEKRIKEAVERIKNGGIL